MCLYHSQKKVNGEYCHTYICNSLSVDLYGQYNIVRSFSLCVCSK